MRDKLFTENHIQKFRYVKTSVRNSLKPVDFGTIELRKTCIIPSELIRYSVIFYFIIPLGHDISDRS